MLEVGTNLWATPPATGPAIPPAAAFAPEQLFAGSTGGFYFKADRETYTNTSRTTAANVGDQVAGWGDLSGNNDHASQGTPSRTPHLREVSGKRVLNYETSDGVNSALEFSTNWPSGVSDVTLFAAFIYNTSSPTYAMTLNLSFATGGWIGKNADTNQYGGGIRDAVNPFGLFGNVTNNSLHYIVSMRDASAGTYELFLDGTSLGTRTSSSGNLTGARSLIRGGPNNPVLECGAIYRSLTAAELTGLQTYLAGVIA